MSKVKVVGIGPGHMDYISKGALEDIEEAKIIYCSQRIATEPYLQGKSVRIYDGRLGTLVEEIETIQEEQVAVLVSGDPGFYSLSKLLSEGLEEVEVIPGLSSFQYLFAKLQRPWQDYTLLSIHGRALSLVDTVKQYKKLVLLTDRVHTPQRIGKLLVEGNMEEAEMVVGARLSYGDEIIMKGTAQRIAGLEFDPLAVVVIDYENKR